MGEGSRKARGLGLALGLWAALAGPARAEDFDLESFAAFWGNFREAAPEWEQARAGERAEREGARERAGKAKERLERLAKLPARIAPEGADWLEEGAGGRKAGAEDFEREWAAAASGRIETGERQRPTLLERIGRERGFSRRQWENCQARWRLEGGFCGHGDRARFESLRFERSEAGWRLSGFVREGERPRE